MPPQHTGNPTLRTGLLFGVILAVLGLGSALLEWVTGATQAVVQTTNGFTSVTVSDTGASALLSCATFLAALALTFVAGMVAASRTGKVGSGTLAGLLAGLLGTLIGNVSGLIVIVFVLAPSVQVPAGSSMTPAQVQALLIGGSIGGAIFGLLLVGGLGAGMGALGGLLGASRWRKTHPAVPYAPLPYYPGYPGYPGYPSYPGPGMPAPSGSVPQPLPQPQPWPSPSSPYSSPYPTAAEQPPNSNIPPYSP